MKHLILGTAGHIDHGKTWLVKALTGTDTDRLAEEKRRGITIDLGFARLLLGQTVELGVIDVPGHQGYLRNMLAGAGQMDLVLLAVAADEGVMPQTLEHLELLELLGAARGAAAITKCDAADREQIDRTKRHLRQILSGGPLAGIPLAEVSAKTGQGLEELRAALLEQALLTEPRPENRPFRMFVDRAFIKAGFGAVATGTILSGRIREGDRVTLLPGEKRLRARGIQCHGEWESQAQAGRRAAVNLAGAGVKELIRGCVLTGEESPRECRTLYVRLEPARISGGALKSGESLQLFLGTACRACRVFLLEGERLGPGGGYGRVASEQPLAAWRGDRFVLRLGPQAQTVGGGLVLETEEPRGRKSRARLAEALAVMDCGSPSEKLLLFCAGGWGRPDSLTQAARRAGLSRRELEEATAALEQEGMLVRAGDYAFTPDRAEELGRRVCAALEEYHREQPFSPGMPKARLLQGLGSLGQPAAAGLLGLLKRQGKLRLFEGRAALAGFRPEESGPYRCRMEELLALWDRSPYGPLTPDQAARLVGRPKQECEAAMEQLVRRGELARLEPGLYLGAKAYRQARQILTGALEREGSITLGKYRDLLGSARKPVQALLEHFDRLGLTRRLGDVRAPGPMLEREDKPGEADPREERAE